MNAADILDNMAHTFRERNREYGSNYKMVAPMVKVLFPDGVPPELVVTDQWHIFELVLVKLSRFAISRMTHVDSIHDMGVYAAMIESLIYEGDEAFLLAAKAAGAQAESAMRQVQGEIKETLKEPSWVEKSAAMDAAAARNPSQCREFKIASGPHHF